MIYCASAAPKPLHRNGTNFAYLSMVFKSLVVVDIHILLRLRISIIYLIGKVDLRLRTGACVLKKPHLCLDYLHALTTQVKVFRPLCLCGLTRRI